MSTEKTPTFFSCFFRGVVLRKQKLRSAQNKSKIRRSSVRIGGIHRYYKLPIEEFQAKSIRKVVNWIEKWVGKGRKLLDMREVEVAKEQFEQLSGELAATQKKLESLHQRARDGELEKGKEGDENKKEEEKE